MSMPNLLEDDLLDLICSNVPSTYGCQGSFPTRCEDPRLLDNLMGTLFIMIPISATSYYFWQWMGWL